MKITTLDELRVLAESIANDGGSRLIVLLDGAMGAGKTQFTKYFLSALGSHETVSPSFALHNSYETARGVVHHFDLFRLDNADDLETTGFWDLFDEDAWLVIEWADKLKEFGLDGALPDSWDRVHLTFKVLPDGSRDIEIER